MFYDNTLKAKLKDEILNYAIQKKEEPFTIYELKGKLFKEKYSYEEVALLFDEIINDKRKMVRVLGKGDFIIGAESTERFLERTSFTAENEKFKTDDLNNVKSEKRKARKEKDDAKLSRLQVVTYPWIFIFALIGAIYSVQDLVRTYAFPKNYVEVEQYEKDIKRIEETYSRENSKVRNELQNAEMLINIYESNIKDDENEEG